jgi:hypothetical protein
MQGKTERGRARQKLQGNATQIKARHGKAWQIIAKQRKVKQSQAKPGQAKQGKSKQRRARQGKASFGSAQPLNHNEQFGMALDRIITGNWNFSQP